MVVIEPPWNEAGLSLGSRLTLGAASSSRHLACPRGSVCRVGLRGACPSPAVLAVALKLGANGHARHSAVHVVNCGWTRTVGLGAE